MSDQTYHLPRLMYDETFYPGPSIPRPASTLSTADPIPLEYRPTVHAHSPRSPALSPCLTSSSGSSFEHGNGASTLESPLIEESSPSNLPSQQPTQYDMIWTQILKAHKSDAGDLFDKIDDEHYGWTTAFQLHDDITKHPSMSKDSFHIQYNSVTRGFEVNMMTPLLLSPVEWFTRQFQRHLIHDAMTRAEHAAAPLLRGVCEFS